MSDTDAANKLWAMRLDQIDAKARANIIAARPSQQMEFISAKVYVEIHNVGRFGVTFNDTSKPVSQLY